MLFSKVNNLGIRFSGVYQTESGKLGFFFNTNGQPKGLKVDIFDPTTGNRTASLPMKPKGPHYWVTEDQDTIPLNANGVYHRFIPIENDNKEGSPLLEPNFYTRSLHQQDPDNKQTAETPFNVVFPREIQRNQTGDVMACIFPDSLVTPERRTELLDRRQQGDQFSFDRNHFNQYVQQPEHSNLLNKLSFLRKSGFTMAMYQPLTGNDRISSHGYWTENPYLQGYRYFGNTEALQTFLVESLRQGIMPIFDGAVVNQGIHGAQYQANLYYGVNSPYWDWFNYPKDPAEMAFEKQSIGLLPTQWDPVTKLPVPNYERTGYRILNDPNDTHYDPNRPILIKYQDPLIYDEKGNLRPPEKLKNIKTFHFEDSMQRVEFHIHEEDLRKKRKLEHKIADPIERKRLFLEWPTFKITTNGEDSSGVKWDGQADVAKLNFKNQVVCDYAIGSFVYWTRFVHNVFAKTLAESLLAEKQTNPTGSPEQWIKALEGKKIQAPRFPKYETLSQKEIETAFHHGQQEVTGPPEQALVAKIRMHYPIYSLPFPTLFSATLTHPKLNELLKTGELPLLLRGLRWIFSPILKPLRKISFLDNLFNKVAGMLWPQSFDELLAQKIAEAFQPLPKNLTYENVQLLVAQPLAKAIYLTLLTGQTNDNPKAVEDGLYKTLPRVLLKADPNTGIKLLNRYLRKELKKLDAGLIAKVLHQESHKLDPELIGLAEALMNKRRFDLNWRIDAAKDLMNTDWLRDAKLQYEWDIEGIKYDQNNQKVEITNAELDRRFKKEFPFMKTFWNSVSQGIRNISPNAVIIGEITNFEKEANIATTNLGRQSYQEFFNDNIFTSAPIWEICGSMMQILHSDPRPDEYGITQKKLHDFFEVLQESNRKTPFTNVLQNQIVTATHDFQTTADKILRNSTLSTTDWLRWGRSEIDLHIISQELLSKPLYDPYRKFLASKGIGEEQLKVALDQIKHLSMQDEFKKHYSKEVLGKLNQDTIEHGIDAENRQVKRNIYPTPLDSKQGLIREFFAHVKPEQLGLPNAEATTALRDTLYKMISEPSEARALKAVLMNTFHTLRWDEMAHNMGIQDVQAFRQQVEPTLKAYLYGTPGQEGALIKAIQTYGRHFGYQPLDLALEHVFENFPTSWDQGLFGQLPAGAVEHALKEQLYRQGIEPVLEVLKRVFALQVALPGIPSIYFHDLLAQTGGCRLKNYFIQNRQLLRDDWLESKPYLKKFYEETTEILNLRHRFVALNNGVMLEVKPSDTNQVIPIIRDNGEQQVMVLINTGDPSSPEPPDTEWNDKAGPGETYRAIHHQHPTIQNYKLDLSGSRIPVGTRYVDPNNGEAFVVNNAYQLVKAQNPSEGLDIVEKPYRVLERV